MFFRALQILTALVATFIGLSLFMTIAFRFVPVPVTWTMALDENGYSKDWRSLDDIDRNMVRAVIAAEDQNFCEHNGFDYAAMQAAMEKVSRDWKRKKNWLTDLHLNIGLDQGEEWFGTFEGPTFIEFTALGDTINRAARLSDFCTDGRIWITKGMMSRLSEDERARIRYGVRQKLENGSETVIPEMYARISNLVDLDDPKHHKLHDIATLAAAELFDVEEPKG